LHARVTSRPRTFLVAASAALVAAASAGTSADAPIGLHENVVFTDYTPLSINSELVRRLLSPLAARQVQRTLAQSGTRLVEQSVDLTRERFTFYVPASAPAQGYALLAFVPPWDAARVPQGWAAVLERYGVIFVSAARSGNAENVIGRRVPLALLAVHNIMSRYTVDRERVYVGGFSGGARVALRLALGYPDLFRGALLNAGSDPLDANPPTLPPEDLFLQFQEASRVVFLTGERDTAHLAMDAASLQSMRKWCVFDVESEIVRGAGHAPADPAALSGALRVLIGPTTPPGGRLAACRAEIDKSLTAQLRRVQSLIDAGQRAEAQRQLSDLDLHFGGLASRRSLELQAALTPAD